MVYAAFRPQTPEGNSTACSCINRRLERRLSGVFHLALLLTTRRLACWFRRRRRSCPSGPEGTNAAVSQHLCCKISSRFRFAFICRFQLETIDFHSKWLTWIHLRSREKKRKGGKMIQFPNKGALKT